MTTTQVVKTSVTNSSLSEDYSHLDDHTRHTIYPDIPSPPSGMNITFSWSWSTAAEETSQDLSRAGELFHRTSHGNSSDSLVYLSHYCQNLCFELDIVILFNLWTLLKSRYFLAPPISPLGLLPLPYRFVTTFINGQI